MSQEEIIELNEKLVAHIFKTVKGTELHYPFPRLTYADAMERYGSDKPDTRYGLELVNVSDILKDSGFKVFRDAVANGGIVKILPIPNGNDAISNVRKFCQFLMVMTQFLMSASNQAVTYLKKPVKQVLKV